jgi:arabinose-5-phosphate isomerase
VIYEVSKSRQGVTLVYSGDVAIGIITDGDIRRAVQKYDDLKIVVATDIMTKGFKKILPDAMITDALKLMDENKITSLVVPENDSPNAKIVGVLHIHNIFDLKK